MHIIKRVMVMSLKTEEFKTFVKNHPGLKKLIYEEHKSWQTLFEEWTLFGEEHEMWEKYLDGDILIDKTDDVKNVKEPTNQTSKEMSSNIGEIIKTCVNYVKKLDTDSVTKTVNNVQKLMSLVAGLGAVNTVNAQNKMTGDPLFDKRFDEWY